MFWPVPVRPHAVLFINRSDSRCGKCNQNADPHAVLHHEVRGHTRGCGALFTAVSSDYMGMDSAVQAMRSDLPWLDPSIALRRPDFFG